MSKLGIILLLLAVVSISYCAITEYLTKSDQTVLKETLLTLLNERKDLPTSYYTVTTLNLLKNNDDGVSKMGSTICPILTTYNANINQLPLEDIYHYVWLSEYFQCQNDIGSDTNKIVKKIVIRPDIESISDLQYAIQVMNLKKIAIDNENQIIQSMQKFLKNNDSLTNFGRAFYIASLLSKHNGPIFEYVEDIVAQVDQVKNDRVSWLQFEGGLSVTSLLFTGFMKLAATLKKPVPINQEQANLFANYLLSRKSVKTAKGIHSLIAMSASLADSSVSPISVTNRDSVRLSKDDVFHVKICDILDRPVKKLDENSIFMYSMPKNRDQSQVIPKKVLKKSSKDSTRYELDIKLDPGHYKVTISIGASDPVLFNTVVLRDIRIESFQFDVVSQETYINNVDKLHYPNKLTATLKTDFGQKLVAKLKLSYSPLQQVFLRFEDEDGRHEFHVPIPYESNNEYVLKTKVKNFIDDYEIISNTYNVNVLIGDIEISNPIDWQIGAIRFDHVEKKEHSELFKPLPEIRHKFREAEKRPPPILSIIFTGLCLVPVLLLFVLWYRIGVNLKGLKLNLYSIVFHGSTAAIIGLLVVFWLQLNMFTTCKYLLGLGIVCFLSGNRLLKSFN